MGMKIDSMTLTVIFHFLVLEVMVTLVTSMFYEAMVTYLLVIAFCLATISIIFRIARRQSTRSFK